MAKVKEPGFNIRSFIDKDEEHKDVSVDKPIETTNMVEVVPAKRGRKPKAKEETVSNAPVPVAQSSMSYIQERIPYATAYSDTNQQLDETIQQVNILSAETLNELQQVRSSKTMKNKYMYINDLTENLTSLINTKLTAIREKNKTIHDVSSLELSRMKELKSTMNQEDDTTRIANLYDAFINTPIGVGGMPSAVIGPSAENMMMQGAMPRVDIGQDQAAWEQNLDPTQNRMLLEARGAIETVVMYDENTGNRWYSVIDKQTGQPVPNVETPDNSTIYDLDINLHQGFAKDPNRNQTYRLVVVGQPPLNEEMKNF